MLKEKFLALLTKYAPDKKMVNKYWSEIETNYSKSNRHYHTLQHLEILLKYVEEVKKEIKEWDAALFALYYHDIVYNTLKHNNEEKSAELAIKRLKEISVDKTTLEKCRDIILATKKHLLHTDNDINIFTDADLSVLGQDWNTYETYLKQVRKEYSIYPDLVYNPGRKKVLQHFLAMDRIYKTEFFSQKFEVQAKQNLQRELALLQQ